MATASDLITAAFYKVGIEVPTSAQTDAALVSLNNMISLLGVDMPPYCVTAEAFTMVVADKEYTIGSGGQWDTVRPERVLSCYLRDGDNFDYPVKVMASKDYNELSNKSLTARPTQLYFLPEYPLAKIIFNASPDYAYSAYFEFVKNFTEFATVGTTVSLPNEYKEAFVYNLAVSLGEDWDRIVPKSLYAQAERTREVVSWFNATKRPAPRAKFDFYGIGGGDIEYNIATDDLIDGGV